jgi:hypothetical protein
MNNGESALQPGIENTFVLMNSDDTWLMSAQDIIQHISLK